VRLRGGFMFGPCPERWIRRLWVVGQSGLNPSFPVYFYDIYLVMGLLCKNDGVLNKNLGIAPRLCP